MTDTPESVRVKCWSCHGTGTYEGYYGSSSGPRSGEAYSCRCEACGGTGMVSVDPRDAAIAEAMVERVGEAIGEERTPVGPNEWLHGFADDEEVDPITEEPVAAGDQA